MKYKVQLGKKEIIIETYKTKDELYFLEYMWCDKMDDYEKEDDYYEIMVDDFLHRCTSYNIKKLSKIEKILLVWKIRELTLGSDVNILFKCSKCDKPQETVISIENLYINANYDMGHEEFISETMLDYTEFENYIEDIEDMDYDKYNELKENFKESFNVYKNKIIFKCNYCKEVMNTNLISFKSCLSFLSEDSFESLTEWLNVLVYYGHHNRNDILEMTPIERMLEVKYFKKIKEEEEKSMQI